MCLSGYTGSTRLEIRGAQPEIIGDNFLKLLVILLVPVLLICAYFFYQGKRSVQLAGPVINNGAIPLCGAKSNCVSSLGPAEDSHFIEPLARNGVTMDTARTAIGQLGGEVVIADENQLHATFKSSVFGFVDDVLILADGDNFQVRSSSRVGHSDLGANRKRLELLRDML